MDFLDNLKQIGQESILSAGRTVGDLFTQTVSGAAARVGGSTAPQAAEPPSTPASSIASAVSQLPTWAPIAAVGVVGLLLLTRGRGR